MLTLTFRAISYSNTVGIPCFIEAGSKFDPLKLDFDAD